MPYLVINTEGRPLMRKSLEGPAIIGRSRDCDVVVDDGRLSRQHCRIEPNPDGTWSLIDLASTNGTFIAGQQISTHRLSDSDEIHAGRTRIIFHSRSAPPARPDQPTKSQPPAPSIASAGGSPSDTLFDSRFRMPRVDPGSLPQGGAASSTSQSTTTRRAPLPFQRPPAKPMVPGETSTARKSNPIRALLQKLFQRRS